MYIKNMVHIVLLALLVMFLKEHGISGHPCRFDGSSSSRRPCIFPCHCTEGCDQVTGQCLNDGHCSDSHPSGYKWRGAACQIGNVALNKNTAQSVSKWGSMYPASKAVDGSINPLSYQHCAVPSAMRSTNAWWKIDFGGNYKLFRVTIYNTNAVFVDAPRCPAIEKRARDRCGNAGVNQLQCLAQGCCWDDEAGGSDIACYKKQCKAGYFGWRCRFKCDKCPTTCNTVTGTCPKNTCQDNRWGVGCMLKNECTYNDRLGTHYMGRTDITDINEDGVKTVEKCNSWLRQTRKTDSQFIDGSLAAAGHFCRNPDNDKRGPWCYYVDHNFAYCTLDTCACAIGRFGVNCDKECHCRDVTEDCQKENGACKQSGCAPHFTRTTCQECKDGYFGVFCDGMCHCRSGNCDKKIGRCPSGCGTGWSGENCQKDERRLIEFTLSVGNSSDVNDHTQCASHNGAVAAGAKVSESCIATGRYLSFRRSGGGENHLTTLCEVVVIGHRYISCRSCPSSTCNDIIGCDACVPGKQQPDCEKDCTDKTYGVNCNETCGHCKDQSKCATTTGSCPNGCETWYISDVCQTYIDTPGFRSLDKPDVDDVTSSSASLSWPAATNIATGLEGYYHYVLWLLVDGEREKNVIRVEQGAGEQRMETRITGLTFNTNYSLRVEPYREHNGEREGGASTGVVTFKTNCTVPSPAVLDSVIQTSPGITANALFIAVKWQVITESGCDALTALRVEYKQAKSDLWKSVETKTVSQTKMTIDNLTYGEYDVRLVVINNENMRSTSDSKHVDVKKPTTAGSKGGGLTPSGIAGTVIGVIVLLAGVSIVVVVVFLRRQRNETAKRADAGHENGGLDGIGNKPEDEDIEDEPVQDTGAIYANIRGINVAELAAYVEDKKRHNGFQKEFGELPSGVRAKCDTANKQEHNNKNRFVNILAYDQTRVVLSSDDGQSDYINANHIVGYKNEESVYLATQGPKPWTIEDMWRMVWQEKTNTIVMLANLYEIGKEKCSQYWPEKGKTQTWGNFIAESTKEEQFADYVIREFSLKNQGLKKMRKIRQLHFTAWPDKGTPDYTYPLLAFHRKVHSFDSQRRGPLLVHCSAGVGRTGTFIAIDILTQQAAAEGKVDVFQCVDLLRTQRVDMVQTLAQYVFVFQALVDTSEDSVIPCSQLTQSFNELCKGTNLNKQFKRLNALKTPPQNQKSAALEPKNVDKNRYIEIIPDDQHRPYLLTPWKDCTNYINAVAVDGYKQRNAYILTQSPMTTTVVDLWRLLNDHESRTVVMLDDVDDTDGYAIYWPTKKEPKSQYGPFEVKLTETNVSENTNVTMRDFKLTKPSKPNDDAMFIRQFHLKRNCWNMGESVPRNKTVLLDLLDLVEKWQQQGGNGPITMHCSDGTSRCGVLVAASYILEHLKLEQEVDVFHAVQHVRTTRSQLVSHLAQYKFLYQVALAYMSQFDTYANFQ